MTTLFDLDVLAVSPARASFGSAAYEIGDGADTVVGHVAQRAGSAFAAARRVLTSYAYKVPATFDVTDAAGNLQLVVERRRTSAVGTGVTAEALLADGTLVARAAGGAGLAQRWTVTDAGGTVLAGIDRADGLEYQVSEPDGRPLADVGYLPATRGLAGTSGRETPVYEIEFRAEATARIRIATLAAVLALDSSR